MADYPYIIAEMSANHHGSLERAKAIIQAANLAGAHAVKLQTYSPDTMVADKKYIIPAGPWAGQNLYNLYAEAMTPLEWHQELFELCAYLDMDCLSTPFDETAVDFLENLDCRIYKVASFEITDLPLIRYIARTGKPMIMSTGMATMEEVTIAVNTAKSAGCNDLTLLKCTSAYPSSHKDANLETMIDMVMRFACPVGISDHTKGTAVPVAAAMMGAECIEKHLKLDDEPGPDSRFSLTPDEFADMVAQVRAVRQAIGDIQYGPGASEMESLIFRRGLYITQDLKAGDTITIDKCRPRRPAMGIQPSYMADVLGMRIKNDAKSGTPLQWDMLTNEIDNLQ